MPFIHIKSLPFKQSLDIPTVISNIANDFATKTSTPLEYIHTTWEFFKPGHYAIGSKTSDHQPEQNCPIIVDLLTPDFNQAETIGVMLTSIADSISTHARFPINNIFINHRPAHSGMVFDDGEIDQW